VLVGTKGISDGESFSFIATKIRHTLASEIYHFFSMFTWITLHLSASSSRYRDLSSDWSYGA